MIQQQATTPRPEPQIVFDGRTLTSPVEVLQAARAKRSELRNQLERIEERRDELRQELMEIPQAEVVVRKGIEQRIVNADLQITEVEKQLAQADAEVVAATAVPGANVEIRRPPPPGPPEEVYVLAGMFIFVVLLPLSIAMARRLWRRSVTTITNLPGELADRLQRIEMAVDAIAVEVERVGEGQRYVTNLFGDTPARALGAGAAEPVELKQREAEFRRR